MADDPLPEQRLGRELALLRATEAPIVFFEVASTGGVRNGLANITLEGGQHVAVDGEIIHDVRIAAHLRFPVAAIPSLRNALDQIEGLLKPVPAALKN